LRYAPSDLERGKELFNLLNVFGEWSRGEGEEKGQKSEGTNQFSFSIKWRLIIQWTWVSKAEDDE